MPASHGAVDALGEDVLGHVGVDGRQRVIEHEKGRVRVDCARNAHALLLPP